MAGSDAHFGKRRANFGVRGRCPQRVPAGPVGRHSSGVWSERVQRNASVCLNIERPTIWSHPGGATITKRPDPRNLKNTLNTPRRTLRPHALASNNKRRFALVTNVSVFRYTVVLDYEHFWVNEETDDIPVAKLSAQEYITKTATNHDYYIYKLYVQNCFAQSWLRATTISIERYTITAKFIYTYSFYSDVCYFGGNKRLKNRTLRRSLNIIVILYIYFVGKLSNKIIQPNEIIIIEKNVRFFFLSL